MKGFLKTKLAKVLIITLVTLFLLGGVVFASTSLWSGTASITIEETIPLPPPEPDPTPDPEPVIPLTLSEPIVSMGTILDGIWTVTIPQGEEATLHLYVENPRDEVAEVMLFVNDSSVNPAVVAPGVVVRQIIGSGFTHTVAPGTQLILEFTIEVDDNATVGILSDVLLEIKEQ